MHFSGGCFFETAGFFETICMILGKYLIIRICSKHMVWGVGQYDVLYAKPSSPNLPESMKQTKFCGVGIEESATNGKEELPTVIASNHYMESVIAALESQLEDAVSRSRKRPGIFFLLGFASGAAAMSMGIFGVLLCRVKSKKRSFRRHLRSI